MTTKTFVGIVGTTSVGKSAVGVELAKLLHTEVVSADSMQIYKGMDIGTAKITESEMDGVKHHMIDVTEPNCNYSSFLYQQEASRIVDGISSVPLVVGGTGFYLDSLLYPPEFGSGGEERRLQLKTILDTQGIETLQDMLRELDPQTYAAIDLCNHKRLIRAIEIAENGKKKSEGTLKKKIPRYDCKLFVLERNREELYVRIDARVDEMMKAGLIDEVKALVSKYGICDTTAYSAIGYKELIAYLNGDCDLEYAVDKIKLNTRHYAKRQITYFKKMPTIEHIDVEGRSPLSIAQHIYDILSTMNLA
ncbi:MAG: tRNA (adenosine(37)-N6)-dimethylallyltransferase MiaA [Corallococcus sp.]|nr:tRNA (adenosine(37)-N6)-dimethylallyltransferase MiaA [Bacillota bacterium]MCM1534137.1 tRNA (adenosine(37)-N6)-dimethylallyltransferase MiaA [Corallococcus sp.]